MNQSKTRSHISRRKFIHYVGIAALGASAAGTLACSSSREPSASSSPQYSGPFLIVSPAEVNVSESQLQNLVSFVSAELSSGTFPGAAVAATRYGKMFFERYWGTYCSRTSRSVGYSSSVVNLLFSLSKLVAATVVVLTRQEGLINYDVPVSTYIPEFTGGGKEQITTRHLLTHSAGIPAWTCGALDTEDKWRAAVASVCAYPCEWEPGTKSLYHALSGLFVAAEVVRRVSQNRPWNTICQERLFDPLGATSMSYLVPSAATPLALTPQPASVPSDYGATGDTLNNHPAGGCYSTITDVLRLMNMHVYKGVWQGRTIMQQSVWTEMHTVQYAQQIADAIAAGTTPAYDSWGLGPLIRGVGPALANDYWWGFANQTGPNIFGHVGIDTTMAVGDPDQELAIVFMTTNSPNPSARATDLRNGVTDRIYQALIR